MTVMMQLHVAYYIIVLKNIDNIKFSGSIMNACLRACMGIIIMYEVNKLPIISFYEHMQYYRHLHESLIPGYWILI